MRYRFVDLATQGYLVLVGLLMVVFHRSDSAWWPWLPLLHGGVILLLHGLIRAEAAGWGGRGVAFLRDYYPILLYTGFYRETGVLNQTFVQGYLDVWFIRLDAHWFGFQPSLELMERWPQLWVSEYFYAAYFSYYLMIAGVGLVLLYRSRAQFQHFVSVVSFVFYCCYLTYIFLPVMGPRIFFMEELALLPPDVHPAAAATFPASVQSGWFFQTVQFLYRHFESPGAAFPSSHVAVAVATLWFSWIYLRVIRWIHLVAAVSLCIATVYCRYHYTPDVVAGVAAAVVLVPLGHLLYRRFEQGRGGRPPQTSPEAGDDYPAASRS